MSVVVNEEEFREWLERLFIQKRNIPVALVCGCREYDQFLHMNEERSEYWVIGGVSIPAVKTYSDMPIVVVCEHGTVHKYNPTAHRESDGADGCKEGA